MLKLLKSAGVFLKAAGVFMKWAANCCCNCCDCATSLDTTDFCTTGDCGTDDDCASGTFTVNYFDVTFGTCVLVTQLDTTTARISVTTDPPLEDEIGDYTGTGYAGEWPSPCPCEWGSNAVFDEIELYRYPAADTGCATSNGNNFFAVYTRLWKNSPTTFRLLWWCKAFQSSSVDNYYILFDGEATVGEDDCCTDLEFTNQAEIGVTRTAPASLKLAHAACDGATATYYTLGEGGTATVTKCSA